ncbi:G2/M phase-specific E3 ubiquitin-protein ligase-like, partial [Clarias magur]
IVGKQAGSWHSTTRLHPGESTEVREILSHRGSDGMYALQHASPGQPLLPESSSQPLLTLCTTEPRLSVPSLQPQLAVTSSHQSLCSHTH